MTRWLWGVVGLFFLATFLLGWWVVKPNPNDEREYQELLNPSSSHHNTSTQRRKMVRKDMFMADKGRRLHTRIESDESELMITHEVPDAELAEEMKVITCMMQEELRDHPSSSQVVRFIEAEQGTYYYSRNLFEADDVFLFRYMLPGHRLVNSLESYSPVMKGQAKKVSLTFGKDIHFTAKQFKAVLYDAEESL